MAIDYKVHVWEEFDVSAAGSDSQLPAVFGHPHRELRRYTVHFGASADVSFNGTGLVSNLTWNHSLHHAHDVFLCMDMLCRNGRSPIQAVIVDLKGLSHASVLELGRSIRKISTLRALPVLALALSLSPASEKQLKEAGISQIVHKPLRYSTLAAVLLETIGVPAKATTKKANVNSKMLNGRKLLVVITYFFWP